MGGRAVSPLRESQALLVEIDASLTAEAAGEAPGEGLPGGAASPEAVLRDTEALLRKGRASAWAAAWAAQASHGGAALPDPGESPAGRNVLEGVLEDVDRHMAGGTEGERQWRSDPGGRAPGEEFFSEGTFGQGGGFAEPGFRADGGREWASAGGAEARTSANAAGVWAEPGAAGPEGASWERLREWEDSAEEVCQEVSCHPRGGTPLQVQARGEGEWEGEAEVSSEGAARRSAERGGEHWEEVAPSGVTGEVEMAGEAAGVGEIEVLEVTGVRKGQDMALLRSEAAVSSLQQTSSASEKRASGDSEGFPSASMSIAAGEGGAEHPPSNERNLPPRAARGRVSAPLAGAPNLPENKSSDAIDIDQDFPRERTSLPSQPQPCEPMSSRNQGEAQPSVLPSELHFSVQGPPQAAPSRAQSQNVQQQSRVSANPSRATGAVSAAQAVAQQSPVRAPVASPADRTAVRPTTVPSAGRQSPTRASMIGPTSRRAVARKLALQTPSPTQRPAPATASRARQMPASPGSPSSQMQQMPLLSMHTQAGAVARPSQGLKSTDFQKKAKEFARRLSKLSTVEGDCLQNLRRKHDLIRSGTLTLENYRSFTR